MKLVKYTTDIIDDKRLRIETHQYENVEEFLSYKALWKRAGFNVMGITGAKPIKVSYSRVVNV